MILFWFYSSRLWNRIKKNKYLVTGDWSQFDPCPTQGILMKNLLLVNIVFDAKHAGKIFSRRHNIFSYLCKKTGFGFMQIVEIIGIKSRFLGKVRKYDTEDR